MIRKNVLWSLFGTGVPMLVGVLTIPTLIDSLGIARFGILTLAWVVVGYFNFFDLGLGRAITKLIAEKIGKGEELEIPAVAQNGLAFMVLLGITGSIIVASISPWLVNSKLAIPQELREETLSSLFLLSISVPIVILTTGLRGILEARRRFDIVNIVRAPLGAIMYLGPLLVVSFYDSLTAVVFALVLGRFVFAITYLAIIFNLYPELSNRVSLDIKLLRKLLSFGGWMTLSNIAGPLLLYLGRMALAVLVTAEAVAYFSTPYDIVINLLLIPTVFVSVLFPMFAENFYRDRNSVLTLYRKSILNIFMVMLPLTLFTYFVAESAISLWIDEEFAKNSARVAEIIVIGIFINSFGHISQALVQAYGRPDLTAKLHVAELIAYVPYMWWLINLWEIEGAAIAWVIRVTISTLFLTIIANGCLKGKIRQPMST